MFPHHRRSSSLPVFCVMDCRLRAACHYHIARSFPHGQCTIVRSSLVPAFWKEEGTIPLVRLLGGQWPYWSRLQQAWKAKRRVP